MVLLFSSPSCTSCRKARAWLQKNGIAYQERNIFTEPLTKNEIKKILQMTENGTEDIISKRSKIYKKLHLDFDTLPMNELFSLLQKHPGLVRRPIIMDEKRIQIGYNEDEIRRFLPRKIRKIELEKAEKRADMLG